MLSPRFARRAYPAAALAALLALQPTPATAAGEGGYYVDADVVRVIPRYGWREVSEPVRECVEVADYDARYRESRRYRGHTYTEQRRRDNELGAGLLGGLLGGFIGNQFGGGNGKKAFTIAGALIGASVASDHARRGDGYARQEDGYAARHYVAPTLHCSETSRTRRERGVDGYDVSYRYQGHTFSKWMDRHPGDRVRVHVDVEPVE